MKKISHLHQQFCEYSLAVKGNSPKTIRWLKDAIRSFVDHSDAEFIHDVKLNKLEEWIVKGKLHKQWSAKTIRTRLDGVSLFIDWCVRKGCSENNPVKDMPRPKLPKRIPKHLSKDEATTLLEWTQHYPFAYKFERKRAVAIIATFIFTGIRLQELRNLKIEHIDFEARTLFVSCGKGEKDRLLPLSYSLIEFLEDYLKERRRLKKECPFFFTAMRQDSIMGERVISRLVVRLRKRSKIYFYPHLLRHTFATLMLEGGCDLFSLSKMLGHSDIRTTTIYLSATTSHLKEQIGKHPLNY